MSDHAIAAPGHNKGPVTAPSSEDMLADLQGRFPEVDTELAQIEKDLATYPKKLTLKDTDLAKALQDLLADAKKLKSNLAGYKKEEKKPWDGITKVVINFFATREEKLAALVAPAAALHEDYMQQKRDETARLAEEEAERQRELAETARKEREEADRRAAEAEERRLAEEQREREARERAAAEEAREKEARERAAAAEAEEKRLAAERREREKVEKDRNADNLKQARTNMKRAKALDADLQALEADEKDPDAAKVQELDALVRAGGALGALLGPVADSHLLDDEQQALVKEMRDDLGVLRKAASSRLDAKEKRRRAKEAREEEERETARAEERRLQRAEDERLEKEARERREAAEREQAEAGQGKKGAQADMRDARAGQREAHSDQKAAGKQAAQAGQVADRADNRADRIDRKLDNSTDADLSRTRGDLGSVGSLRRNWKHHIVDEAALRAASGPLGPHFTADALENALFHVMRAHQSAFTGERVPGETIGVPGALFTYETDAQIRS